MVGAKKKSTKRITGKQPRDQGRSLLDYVVHVIQRFSLLSSLSIIFFKNFIIFFSFFFFKKKIRKKGLAPPKEKKPEALPKQAKPEGIVRRGPRKELKDMTKRRKDQILAEIWKGVKEIAGKNSKEAIVLLAKRLSGEEEEKKWKDKFQQLSSNVKSLFDSQIQENRGKAAAVISGGFTLREGCEITGLSKPMISIGRKILVSSISARRGRHPAEIPTKEKEDFRSFALEQAPVKSGSKKDRRLQENSFKEFYTWEYLPWSHNNGYPPRSITKVKEWLNALGIKPNKFDRYRCLICFEGKEAKKRQREGRSEEGDEEKVRKMEEHERIYRHQLEAAKKDKATNSPKKLLLIYDYTTIHDLTTVKVSFFLSPFSPFLLFPQTNLKRFETWECLCNIMANTFILIIWRSMPTIIISPPLPGRKLSSI